MSARMRVLLVPVLAMAGLLDATYLAVLHLLGEIPPCGAYRGCEAVNTSLYSELFGIPVAALGAMLYAAILGLALPQKEAEGTGRIRRSLMLYAITLAGALSMGYLTAVELFVLHAICYWCIALALITFALLAIVVRDVWVRGVWMPSF